VPDTERARRSLARGARPSCSLGLSIPVFREGRDVEVGVGDVEEALVQAGAGLAETALAGMPSPSSSWSRQTGASM